MSLQGQRGNGVSNSDIGTSYERPLIFSEVSMGFLYTFYLNLDDKYLDTDEDCVSLKVKEVAESLRENFRNYTGELITEWNCKDNEAKWNAGDENCKDIAEEFERIEKFFSDPKNIFAKHFRFALGEIYIKCSDFEKNRISPFCYIEKLELFLNIYPRAKEAILYFTLKLKDNCNCNDIVLLRQYFMEKRHEVLVSIPDDPRYYRHERWFSKPDFAPEKYINLIQGTLGKKTDEDGIKAVSQDFIITNIIEIRKLCSCVCTDICKEKCFWDIKPVTIDYLKQRNPNLSSYVHIDDCAQHLIKTYPKQIYSLLVGDEGWKYVPRKLALSRIKNKAWSSRGYFSVFALDKSVLIFNFVKTKRHRQYKEEQKNLSDHYKQELEPYFGKDYQIPGAQHGPLFWLEIVSITKCYSDNILRSLTNIDKYYKFLNEFKTRERKKSLICKIMSAIISPRLYVGDEGINEIDKMLLAMDVVSCSILDIDEINKKWEVEQLGNLINQTLSIPSNINKLQTALNSIEGDLSLKYQHRNNILIGVLTIGGLILAVISILVTLVPKS